MMIGHYYPSVARGSLSTGSGNLSGWVEVPVGYLSCFPFVAFYGSSGCYFASLLRIRIWFH